MNKEHLYQIHLIWTGNKGQGTKNYQAYDRSLTILAKGKPDLLCSADPLFKGDASKWNPEELLVASLSSCHMLSYLYLCAVHDIIVIEYQDQPEAKMTIESSGKGYFSEVILQPKITITDPKQIALAEELNTTAHEKCFIANSVNFSVKIKPTITS